MKSFLPAKSVVLILLGLAIAFWAMLWPFFLVLHQRWMDEDEPYTSSYIVLAMVAYLIWKRLRSLPLSAASPCWSALPVTVVCVALCFVAYVTQTMILAQLVLPVMFLSWVMVVTGWRVTRYVALPVLLSYTVVPIWGVLGVPLRTMAVAVVEGGLGIIGIPAYIDGFLIQLPGGVVEVAGGCSGQNYLITGIIIGGFYAINYLKGYSRIVCLLLIAAFSILANWVRVFLLVLVGYYTDLTHPLMTEHRNFGWFVFAFALIGFFFSIRWLEARVLTTSSNVASDQEDDRAAVGKAWVFAAVTVLVVSSVLPLHFLSSADEGSATAYGLELKALRPLTRFDTASPLPAYEGYDIAQQWRTNIQGVPTVITALVYNRQVQGKELINGTNRLTQAEYVTYRGTLQSASGLPLGQVKTMKRGKHREIYWVYRIGEWYATSGLQGKMLQVPASLLGEGKAALITFAMDCQLGCQKDRELEYDPEYIAGIEEVLLTAEWANSQPLKPL